MKKQLKTIAVSVLTTALLACGAVVASAAQGSRFSDETALSYLKGKSAIHLAGNTIYSGNEKRELASEAILRNDISLISEADFEAFFGVNVSRFGKKIRIGTETVMTQGLKECSVNGVNETLTEVPEVIDSVLYLPIEDYVRVTNNQNFFDDNHGMYILGNSKSDNNALKEANIYMFFEREDAQTLKDKLFQNTQSATKHPRLIATSEDFKRIAKEVKEDSLKSKWYSQVIYTANSIVKEPVLQYKISNGRLLDVANAALLRMQYLGFAYQVTGNTKYSDKGIAELKSICSFDNWHPEHYLDTGTMATATAIGYDWLYEAMSEDERSFIAQAAQKLAIDTALAGYTGEADYNDFWCESDTNWSVICNGGIANLALATAEYNTDKAMDALENALRSVEYAWYRFAPDGAWHEGPDYWGYQLQHLGLFMSCYETAMGEAFAKNYPGLDKYAYFGMSFSGPDGMSNNFHDANESLVHSDAQFYLAKLFDDTSLMEYRAWQIKQNNIKPSAMDIIWCGANISEDILKLDVKKDEYFGETEFVSMRSGFDKNDTWVSFHGGALNNAHDHIDSGSFVFVSEGVRWAIDLGKEELSYLPDSENPSILAGYNSKYFYRRKGEGHNIVVINPDSNLEMDLNSFSKVTEPVSGIDNAFSTVDLTQAYDEKVSKYFRGYRLDNERKVLTVRDEITLEQASEMYWFMHTEGEIEIVDNNNALIHQDGKTLCMNFITNADSAELDVMEAIGMESTPDFENTENTGVSKIAYKISGSGLVNITVCMYVMDGVGTKYIAEDVSIEQWRVDVENTDEVQFDEEITLYVNGEKSNIISEGELSAEINVYAPSENPIYGKLIFAVYRNGRLESVTTNEERIIQKVTLNAGMSLENVDDVSVKTMFWDEEMKPYLAVQKYN